MMRTGADLALLLLHGFRSLADAATAELAERGFDDVRPHHEFALRAIAAGCGNASELGRHLEVSKQAAAKTIALLVERGYAVSRAAAGTKRRQLEVTDRGHAMMREGEAIFDDLRIAWERVAGAEAIAAMERNLRLLVAGSAPPCTV